MHIHFYYTMQSYYFYSRDFTLPEEDFDIPAAAAFGPVEFRDDLDLIEQVSLPKICSFYKTKLIILIDIFCSKDFVKDIKENKKEMMI